MGIRITEIEKKERAQARDQKSEDSVTEIFRRKARWNVRTPASRENTAD